LATGKIPAEEQEEVDVEAIPDKRFRIDSKFIKE
jgi:hypothetical protein